MSTNLIKTQESSDKETGLLVKGSIYASSGFNYLVGTRQFQNLKIVEGISKGTGCIFLSSVMVYNENGVLIYDAQVKRHTNYSREKVRQLVLTGIVTILRDAVEKQSNCLDELEAYEKVDELLKDAYYQQSYAAVLEFAKEIGITIN